MLRICKVLASRLGEQYYLNWHDVEDLVSDLVLFCLENTSDYVSVRREAQRIAKAYKRRQEKARVIDPHHLQRLADLDNDAHAALEALERRVRKFPPFMQDMAWDLGVFSSPTELFPYRLAYYRWIRNARKWINGDVQ